jgi:hypothetical protein
LTLVPDGSPHDQALIDALYGFAGRFRALTFRGSSGWSLAREMNMVTGRFNPARSTNLWDANAEYIPLARCMRTVEIG